MGNETDCMVGNPGIPVLADLVLKGYVKDNKEGAYEAMKQSALRDDRGLGLLKKYGYLPYDKDPEMETVAKGLEYALADDCVAKVARLLGKKADAKYFAQRAQTYRKYFDKQTGFMRGIGTDGKFRVPFNPFSATYFNISAALFMEETAMKLEGMRKGRMVASSEGRNIEAMRPTGFTGAPKPSQPTVSKARSVIRVK
jgi:putative alpha-1,2-mannosidase